MKSNDSNGDEKSSKTTIQKGHSWLKRNNDNPKDNTELHPAIQKLEETLEEKSKILRSSKLQDLARKPRAHSQAERDAETLENLANKRQKESDSNMHVKVLSEYASTNHPTFEIHNQRTNLGKNETISHAARVSTPTNSSSKKSIDR